MGHRKNLEMKQTEIHFSIFIENRSWYSKIVFRFNNQNKNEKISTFGFILKQKSKISFYSHNFQLEIKVSKPN